MTVRSLVAGAAFGAAAGLLRLSAARAFGDAPDANATLLVVMVAAIVLGFHADVAPANRGRARRILVAPSPRVALWTLAGITLIAAWFSLPFGGLIATLGGRLAAGPVALAVARALVAGMTFAPVAWIFGTLIRRSLILDDGEPMRFAPFAIAGSVLGALGVQVAAELPRGTALAGALAAIGVAGVSWLGAESLRPRKGYPATGTSRPTPIDGEELADPPEASASSGFLGVLARIAKPSDLPAISLGIAGAAWPFLAPRLFSFAAASELGGVPFAELSFLAACAGGALTAALIPRSFRIGGATQASIALLVAAALIVLRWPRYDELVPRFAEWSASPTSFGATVANALRCAAALVGPAGALFGFALASLGREVPDRLEDRRPWVERTIVAACCGFLIGLALVHRFAPRVHLEGKIESSALAAGLLAAAGIALSSRFSLVRILAGLLGACAMLAATQRIHVPDRNALLVEREVAGSNSGTDRAPKNWITFDEDGRGASFAIARRGHVRRLLVDGRFDAVNATVKSHGLLAHLPLLLHPAPRRVIVLGSGNGLALDAALAHPVEWVECLETDRTPVRATAMCGPEAERSLLDVRLGIRLGDFEDLLARAPLADVILNQSSGRWTDRAARTSTIEFLTLAKSRLAEDGILCHWVRDSALTKQGFLILLKTYSLVFPQVEVWGGQEGDVVILARKTKSGIDAARLVERFRDCPCAESVRAAWIEEPVTLLSNFLVSDTAVRRLCSAVQFHARGATALTREEAARRRSAPLVNPVPGLAALGDDVTKVLVAPGPDFEEAVRRGVRARALEREAITLEQDQKKFEAVDAFEEARQLNPFDGSVRRSFALLRARMGVRYAEDNSFLAAHNNFRAAVEIDTTFAEGFATLGGLLLVTGPPDYALSTTHQAVQLHPDDDLAWTQLGAIRRRQGLYLDAMPYFQKALEINPRNVDAAMGYIDAKLESSETPDVAEAVDYLEKFLPLDPDNITLKTRVAKYRDALKKRESPDAIPNAEGFTMPEGFEAFGDPPAPGADARNGGSKSRGR